MGQTRAPPDGALGNAHTQPATISQKLCSKSLGIQWRPVQAATKKIGLALPSGGTTELRASASGGF